MNDQYITSMLQKSSDTIVSLPFIGGVLALILVVVAIVAVYRVIGKHLQFRSPDWHTAFPPEYRHLFKPRRSACELGEPCCDRHDWQLVHEKKHVDDTTLNTFWCRCCGAITLQRDDDTDHATLRTAPVWFLTPQVTHTPTLHLLFQGAPAHHMSWSPESGQLRIVDTQRGASRVFTPSRETNPQ